MDMAPKAEHFLHEAINLILEIHSHSAFKLFLPVERRWLYAIFNLSSLAPHFSLHRGE